MSLLCEDLFKAYYSARLNKRNTINQLKFELNFEQELFRLHDELLARTYKPEASIAFVVNKPVKREIFAASFRDRVIHHLLFNYLNPIFEKHLIFDCYSCRTGKGTSEGIRRMARFMRACSNSYTSDCYMLKLDIKSYFIDINRHQLYGKINQLLAKEYNRVEQNNVMLSFDRELGDFLLRVIIFNEPIKNCRIKGDLADWDGLPRDKSLFYATEGCGLPIGNLTSQLFGNFYMAGFDHWMKRTMGFSHYGRYVDDFVVFHPDKELLVSVIPIIREYLQDTLGLTLHPRKIYLQHYTKGLSFLGAIIKPGRVYAGKRVVGNFRQSIQTENLKLTTGNKSENITQTIQLVNSYLGLMRNYRSYTIRKEIILGIHPDILSEIVITKRYGMLKRRLKKKAA
jgi:RNA-directed DNA polymerase